MLKALMSMIVVTVLSAGVSYMLFSKIPEKALPHLDPADVKLITRLPQNDPLSLQALIGGRLWIHNNCVKIGETMAQSKTTIWRAGHVVGQDKKGLFIHRPDHQLRHRIGEEVRFGGGYLGSFDVSQIEGGDFKGCTGPFILIDETMVRKNRFWNW